MTVADTVVRAGFGNRPVGSSLARFAVWPSSGPADRGTVSLPPGHAALTESRTVFPSQVFDPSDEHRVLVDGHNNAKIGKWVVKGAWKGLRIYTITFEERATCPTSCGLLRECYGNSMHMAKRKRYGEALLLQLDRELRQKAIEHPKGFVVRLHVLGDFPDLLYVEAWRSWMRANKRLRVWGYTAHAPDTEMGRAINRLNGQFPNRWRVRFSMPPGEVAAGSKFLRATTIWNAGDEKTIERAIVCPVERGKAETCGSCGLCWHQPADNWPIVFWGHGTDKRGPRRAAAGAEPVDRPPVRIGRPPIDRSEDWMRGYQAGYVAGSRRRERGA